LIVPKKKQKILEEAHQQVQEIEEQYRKGLISDGERYNKVIDIWAKVSEEVAAEMMKELSEQVVEDKEGKKKKISSFNPILFL